MLEERRKLKMEDVNTKSLSIFKLLKQTEEFKKANSLMICISSDNEVDTKEIIKYCLSERKTVCVPKIISKGIMIAIKIDSLNFKDDFTKNKYGIYEPVGSVEISPEKIDLIIVPMVASDLSYNRLGYGGGYYDRFLSKTNADRIGLCYDFQLLKDKTLPTDKYDIKMTKIITEYGMY